MPARQGPTIAGPLQPIRSLRLLTAEEVSAVAVMPDTWLLELACGHHVLRRWHDGQRTARCGECRKNREQLARMGARA